MAIKRSRYSLLILGIAGGAGYVYEGLCSSAFLILKDDHAHCLVDMGLGVTRALQEYGYGIPDTVIITHNHTDHAGELPVVIRVEEAKGRKLNIISAAPVSERLKLFRMAEHNDLYAAESLANWIGIEPGKRVPLTDELDIRFLATQHSELCFGFELTRKGESQPLLGYSGDTGYFEPLYEQLSHSSYAIYDARPQGNKWHAGFDQLKSAIGDNYFVISHGLVDTVGSDLNLLKPGQRIHLGREPENEVC